MNCLTRPMALVVVLLATAPVWAEQPKVNPADVKALHELHREFLAAYNRGDAVAVAALYTPDADLFGVREQIIKGRAEIEKNFASFLARNKGIQVKASFGSLRFLTPDVAIADRFGELTPVPEGGPSKIHATDVYVKRDGKWRIAAVRLAPLQSSK